MNRRKIINNFPKLLTLLFFIAVIPLTLDLVSQNQDIRKKADAPESAYIKVVPNGTIKVGDTIVVTLTGIPQNTFYVMGAIIREKDYWEIVPGFSKIKITNAIVFNNGIQEEASGDQFTESILILGSHNINTPMSGDLFEIRLKAKKAGTNLFLSVLLVTLDENAHKRPNISENIRVNILANNSPQVTPTPTNSSIPTPTVTPAGGPNNSISAPAQPTADASAYQITVSLSANPRPTTDNQGKTVRLVFSDSNSTPTTDMFFGGNAATIGTFTNSYTARFSLGRDGQQKKFWAIFHNDVRKNDGWSDPVSTSIFTFGPGGSNPTPLPPTSTPNPTPTPIPAVNTPTPTTIPITPSVTPM